jgi:excisionase family DNA binding protein
MSEHEPYLNLKEAAAQLGLPYHQIQRAAKKGLIPSYRPFGRRPLVRISEVTAFIEASRIDDGRADTPERCSAARRVDPTIREHDHLFRAFMEGR